MGRLGVPGATLGSATAGESLHLSVPRFARLWNGVTAITHPPGTFSELCLKGCSHWHRATCPWPDRADTIDTACDLCLQNGPCALWDFTSPCVAPLRHPGLGSILPQLLPGLSPGLGVCPSQGGTAEAPLSCSAGAERVSPGGNEGFHRLGRVLSQVSARTMSLLCDCKLICRGQSALHNPVKKPVPCPEQWAVSSRKRW